MATLKKPAAKAAKAPAAPKWVEPAPIIVETEAVAEAAPVEAPAPAPEEPLLIAAPPAPELLAAPTPEPLAEPAPTIAAEAPSDEPKSAISVVVNFPDVMKMVDINKIVEAPLASLTEAQGKARSLAEAGLTETRAKFTQFKGVADEATSALETSFASAKSGAIEFNTKALEALKATAEANFDFVKSVFAVKSPSEYVTLHTEFARKQIESLQTNAKAFGELAQKIATHSVEPIKAQVAKSFNLPH
jgi:phasin